MVVDKEYIDYLYRAPKVCDQVVAWQPVKHCPIPVFHFAVDVVTADGALLVWRGHAASKPVKGFRWSFSLKYRSRYEVRAWDMGRGHACPVWGGRIPGRGRHVHAYHDDANERAQSVLAEGDISVVDPSQAVLDFAHACHIELAGGYQSNMTLQALATR